MKTVQQLVTDLDNLQKGDSWLGYNALQVLNGIDASSAASKAYEKGNSIWKLVNHISYWRAFVAKRVKEKRFISSAEEGFSEPLIKDEESWNMTVQHFIQSYEDLRSSIALLKEEELFTPLENGQTLYYNINGCILHDAFHLGQVIILKRMAGINA